MLIEEDMIFRRECFGKPHGHTLVWIRRTLLTDVYVRSDVTGRRLFRHVVLWADEVKRYGLMMIRMREASTGYPNHRQTVEILGRANGNDDNADEDQFESSPVPFTTIYHNIISVI